MIFHLLFNKIVDRRLKGVIRENWVAVHHIDFSIKYWRSLNLFPKLIFAFCIFISAKKHCFLDATCIWTLKVCGCCCFCCCFQISLIFLSLFVLFIFFSQILIKSFVNICLVDCNKFHNSRFDKVKPILFRISFESFHMKCLPNTAETSKLWNRWIDPLNPFYFYFWNNNVKFE